MIRDTAKLARAINQASYCEGCGERPHGPSYKRKCSGGTAVVVRDELVTRLIPLLDPAVDPRRFVTRACHVTKEDEAVTDDERSQF